MSGTPKEFRLWEDPENWISLTEARKFVASDMLDTLRAGSKVCIIPGGEIADGILVNDFTGGIHILIEGDWRRFRDEDTAYQTFLEKDPWAS